MRRRLSPALAILLAGAALVAGALARPAGTADAPRGGTLRIMSPGELDHVDPALAYLSEAWMVEYATCAKLFNQPDRAGPEGTRVVPEVADGYTVSPDRRTYTFDLKKTFRFHTGAPVTAQSFADAIDRLLQPRLGSPASRYLRDIVGVAAVLEGKARTISGVRVLGRYRLQIRLTRPTGDLTARLTMPFFCPILPKTPPVETDSPPGSGPYYVAERVPNQRTVLERNRFYRGNRPANVDRIVWTPGVAIDACLQAVEDDRADFCGEPGAPRTAYKALSERYGLNRPGGRLFVRPSLSTWFIAFNHDRPAFRGSGQIPLKKAINYAIDRPELARAYGGLAGRRTDQMLAPGLARAASIYPRDGADPLAARRWYRQARFQPTKLVLYAWTIPPVIVAARVIVYNLAQLGIEVEVKYFEPSTVIAKAMTPGEPVDLVVMGWAPDYADGAAYFEQLLGRGGGTNVVKADDRALQGRIDAASRLTGEARRRAWAELDVDLMRDNPPWAPFLHVNHRAFVSPSLGCFVEHPIYRVDLVAVCKKR